MHKHTEISLKIPCSSKNCLYNFGPMTTCSNLSAIVHHFLNFLEDQLAHPDFNGFWYSKIQNGSCSIAKGLTRRSDCVMVVEYRHVQAHVGAQNNLTSLVYFGLCNLMYSIYIYIIHTVYIYTEKKFSFLKEYVIAAISGGIGKFKQI